MTLMKTPVISLFRIANMRNIMFVLGVFAFASFSFGQEKSKNTIEKSAKDAYDEAGEIKHKNPVKAIELYDLSFEKYLEVKDTLNATHSLLQKALVYENNANYTSSYDAIWTALILCDQYSDDKIKSVIYSRLGRIYSYYKREDESLRYLKKALEIQKNIESRGEVQKSDLVPYYYAIAKTNRELEHFEVGQVYLDSCYLYYVQSNDLLLKAYLDFEKANLLFQEGESEEALKIFEDIYPWFEAKDPSHLVLIYKYWGDIYLRSSNLDKSEELYHKSLQVSEDYKSHIDFTPLVYEKLAELSLQRKDYKEAYANLQKAKDLDAEFFDGRSSNNQSLLEIKDSYRLEKERQQKQIQEQYLKQLEQEDKINELQLIILLGSIVFLVLIGYSFIRNLRAKHKTEKELLKRKNELEIQKTKELLELKNKELASSALQLIEKDEFLKNIKSIVRGKDDKLKIHEINKALRSISNSNNQNWEEFKLRFIDVNKEFYVKIFEKYPNLSQSDQKICALIKLNFSSKEMARLLGISVESVHTSRHRIRKKMDLSRSINLENYINSL